TLPVWSAENASVEKHASTTSQTSVGIHHSRMRCFEPAGDVSSACQGKMVPPTPPARLFNLPAIPCRLFNLIVRRFTGDDHIMHVALAQPSAADANKPCLLLQVRNGVGAAVAHPGTQSANQLINHGRQRTPIRHAALNPFRNKF